MRYHVICQISVERKKDMLLKVLGRFVITLNIATIGKLIFFIGDPRRVDDNIDIPPQSVALTSQDATLENNHVEST